MLTIGVTLPCYSGQQEVDNLALQVSLQKHNCVLTDTLKTTNTSCHSEQLAAPRGVENFLRGGRTCSRAHQLQVVSCATSYNSKKRKLLERQTHVHISCHLSPVHLVDHFRHFSCKFSPVLVLLLTTRKVCIKSYKCQICSMMNCTG